MKLTDIDLGGEATLTLEHPGTGEKLHCDEDNSPMTITVVGQESEAFRKTLAKISNREMRGRKKNVTFEKTEEQSCELLAACTIGWNIEVGENGLEAFSEKAVYDLYLKIPWVRKQVDEFIGVDANFLASA